MPDPEAMLKDAESIVEILRCHRIDALIIGAIALAAYNYVRQTEDIDLAVNADLKELRAVVQSLQEAGYKTELHEPDADDPLGGVIDVNGAAGLLQVINYGGRFPAIIDDAVRESKLLARPGSCLKLVPIPHLIALKLYAGGYKSKADIVELLICNPQVDIEEVKSLCDRYRLRGLNELIAEADKFRGNSD